MPGIVSCTVVVGGCWIIVVFLRLFIVTGLIEACVGKSLVALPVGKAMTRSFCEHVSKNISTQDRIIVVIFVGAGELIGKMRGMFRQAVVLSTSCFEWYGGLFKMNASQFLYSVHWYETRKIDLIHQTSRPMFEIQKIPGRIGNGNHISV